MAPVTETYASSIWVIHQEFEDGETTLVEAHVSHESALAAMKLMGHMHVDVQELDLKSVIDIEAPVKKSKKSSSSSSTSKKSSKKVKDSDSEGDEEDDSSGDESSRAKDDRHTLPDLSNVKQNVLEGMKITFVGNFEKVRKICQATAIFAGAQVTSTLNAADYIILGSKATDKRLAEIEDLSRETISEQEFYAMLQTGFPKHKRKPSITQGDGEAPRKKQKK